METAYFYLCLSGVLTVLLWTPYIGARIFVWGIPVFLLNYPKGFPKEQPEPPMWALRAHRAHMNMVETMPAFVAVVAAAGFLLVDEPQAAANVGTWAKVFFFSRIAHAFAYTTAIPAVRTPIYLISWAAILMIARSALTA